MTAKRSGLGRNLSALLGHGVSDHLAVAKMSHERQTLPIECLQPGKYQPRAEIEPEPLDELAASIKQQGVLQALIVRELAPPSGRYEIIAGERRWRACQLVGLSEVPVVVRQVDDETAMAIALVENLQREDLNVMDQARAMHRLTEEFDLTHQQVAELLCKSRTAVSNYLRLLSLQPQVKQLLEHGDLDMGHARSLLMLGDEQQIQAAQLVVTKQLSVRDTEKLVTRLKNGNPAPIALTNVSTDLQKQVQQLAQQLQTKIKIKPGKTGKGTLTIHYNTLPNLQRLIEQLIHGSS